MSPTSETEAPQDAGNHRSDNAAETQNARAPEQPFEIIDIKDKGKIINDKIDEASGIVASIKNRGVLYLHNDSGGKPRIYICDYQGRDLGRIKLKIPKVKDCEDIALMPGDPKAGRPSCILLGDIGDNTKSRKHYAIYRIVEPRVDPRSHNEIRVEVAETIKYKYPKGQRLNAETLLYDPISRDIYIVSKRDRFEKGYDKVFRIKHKNKYRRMELAEELGFVKIPPGFLVGYGAVGGDISFDGSMVVIKTYTSVYYWERSPGRPLAELLCTEPKKLPYRLEPQGESICFSPDAKGYFTVSEERKTQAHLMHYRSRR
ncbi:MAG: hypothetical protein CSA62_07155 [Planctomycetota bacterium]|nr:MAG: hypothetical protein CSA62_07155 [Planctomycetota bacterium]